MKTLLLAALLSLGAVRARAERAAPQSVSQDPLTQQIQRQAIQGSNVVYMRLGKGSQTVALKVVDLETQPMGGAKAVSFSAPGDALGDLKPAAGLVEKRPAKATRKSKLPKPAVEQAVIIKKGGWTPARGVGHQGAL